MPAGHRAVSVLYQALLTGLVLTLVTRRGEEQAAEFVFRLFRRQHLEKFRPGLAKLGLDRLPHAVACAQYHFLSNMGSARDLPPAIFDAWNDLWTGALSIHDRRARLRVDQRPDGNPAAIVWRIAR